MNFVKRQENKLTVLSDSQEYLIITSDRIITEAAFIKGGRSTAFPLAPEETVAQAVRNLNDEYNFFTGADLAYSRLYEKLKPGTKKIISTQKEWSGWVVCTNIKSRFAKVALRTDTLYHFSRGCLYEGIGENKCIWRSKKLSSPTSFDEFCALLYEFDFLEVYV